MRSRAGGSSVACRRPDRPETCQRPASCGKVLEQSADGLRVLMPPCGQRSSAASPPAACAEGLRDLVAQVCVGLDRLAEDATEDRRAVGVLVDRDRLPGRPSRLALPVLTQRALPSRRGAERWIERIGPEGAGPVSGDAAAAHVIPLARCGDANGRWTDACLAVTVPRRAITNYVAAGRRFVADRGRLAWWCLARLGGLIDPATIPGRGAALQSRLVRAIEPYARSHSACVAYTPSIVMPHQYMGGALGRLGQGDS